MNHMQSLKFEHKLYTCIKEKMEEMQQHNMSWIEVLARHISFLFIRKLNNIHLQVQFLKRAVDILCQCRQTLMCTYVFAYYLRKNNQSLIFEANQKDLESATEKLSEYLERDITSENLADIKQKVQDKYRWMPFRTLKMIAPWSMWLIFYRSIILQILREATKSPIGPCSRGIRARLVVVHRVISAHIQKHIFLKFFKQLMNNEIIVVSACDSISMKRNTYCVRVNTPKEIHSRSARIEGRERGNKLLRDWLFSYHIFLQKRSRLFLSFFIHLFSFRVETHQIWVLRSRAWGVGGTKEFAYER